MYITLGTRLDYFSVVKRVWLVAWLLHTCMYMYFLSVALQNLVGADVRKLAWGAICSLVGNGEPGCERRPGTPLFLSGARQFFVTEDLE